MYYMKEKKLKFWRYMNHCEADGIAVENNKVNLKEYGVDLND